MTMDWWSRKNHNKRSTAVEALHVLTFTPGYEHLDVTELAYMRDKIRSTRHMDVQGIKLQNDDPYYFVENTTLVETGTQYLDQVLLSVADAMQTRAPELRTMRRLEISGPARLDANRVSKMLSMFQEVILDEMYFVETPEGNGEPKVDLPELTAVTNYLDVKARSFGTDRAQEQFLLLLGKATTLEELQLTRALSLGEILPPLEVDFQEVVKTQLFLDAWKSNAGLHTLLFDREIAPNKDMIVALLRYVSSKFMIIKAQRFEQQDAEEIEHLGRVNAHTMIRSDSVTPTAIVNAVEKFCNADKEETPFVAPRAEVQNRIIPYHYYNYYTEEKQEEWDSLITSTLFCQLRGAPGGWANAGTQGIHCDDSNYTGSFPIFRETIQEEGYASDAACAGSDTNGEDTEMEENAMNAPPKKRQRRDS